MIRYNEEEFIEICKTSKSMQEASIKMKIHFNSFKRIALKLNCYFPNQSGIGIEKKWKDKIKTEEILNGMHPSYQTYKLKLRLFDSGIKNNECEMCGLSEWMGIKLNCELDHINGDRTDHRLENLKILCPNCHSQTSTFRAKNIMPR